MERIRETESKREKEINRGKDERVIEKMEQDKLKNKLEEGMSDKERKRHR